MFISEAILDDEDTEEADAVLIELLYDWQADGRSPAAMLNAMAALLDDITDSVSHHHMN